MCAHQHLEEPCTVRPASTWPPVAPSTSFAFRGRARIPKGGSCGTSSERRHCYEALPHASDSGPPHALRCAPRLIFVIERIHFFSLSSAGDNGGLLLCAPRQRRRRRRPPGSGRQAPAGRPDADAAGDRSRDDIGQLLQVDSAQVRMAEAAEIHTRPFVTRW